MKRHANCCPPTLRYVETSPVLAGDPLLHVVGFRMAHAYRKLATRNGFYVDPVGPRLLRPCPGRSAAAGAMLGDKGRNLQRLLHLQRLVSFRVVLNSSVDCRGGPVGGNNGSAITACIIAYITSHREQTRAFQREYRCYPPSRHGIPRGAVASRRSGEQRQTISVMKRICGFIIAFLII